ncbi:MAG: hypothetical protein QJR13_01385 [Bacillota bacterium]|nr:hypothetical protein [Bacillota bacterium]
MLLALVLAFGSGFRPAPAVAGPLPSRLAAPLPQPVSPNLWEEARAREWDSGRGLPPGQEVQAGHRLSWGRMGMAVFFRRTPMGWQDDLSTAVATAQFRLAPRVEVGGTVAGLSRPAWSEDWATLALHGRWWLTDQASVGGEYAVNQKEGRPSAWALDAEASGANLFLHLGYDSAEQGFVPHPDLPRQAGCLPGGRRWSVDAEGLAGPGVLAGGWEVQEGESGDRQTKRYARVELAVPGAVGRLEVVPGVELVEVGQRQADGHFSPLSSTRQYSLDFRWQPGGGVALSGGYTLAADSLQRQPLFGQAEAGLRWPVREDLALTASLSTRLDFFGGQGGRRWRTEGVEAHLAARF